MYFTMIKREQKEKKMFDGKGAISSRLFLRSLDHFPRSPQEHLPFYLMGQD